MPDIAKKSPRPTLYRLADYARLPRVRCFGHRTSSTTTFRGFDLATWLRKERAAHPAPVHRWGSLCRLSNLGVCCARTVHHPLQRRRESVARHAALSLLR